MVDDLDKLRPDVIVVDTLDRFTRNLREGLELLEQIRGHRVGLLPLDWRRERAIDVDDDRDWSDVVEEFTAAERERRRIRRRIQRAYEGRRERGATTTNRAPFGLRKAGDVLVVDESAAWIVREAESQLLGGASANEVARWCRQINPRAWKSRNGLMDALDNPAYVQAGLRAPERQAALDDILDRYRERFAYERKHDHELTGVFACGFCGHLMHGRYSTTNVDYVVVCSTVRKGASTHAFIVSYRRIGTAWRDMLARLTTDTKGLATWAAADPAVAPERAQLAALARIDQQAAAAKRRRDAAFDMLADGDPALADQARQMLREVNLDERELQTRREVLAMAQAEPARARRSVDEVRAYLESVARVYDKLDARGRNELSRAFCRLAGSHPRLARDGAQRKTLRIEWPEFGLVVPLTFEATGSARVRVPSTLK